MAEVVQADVVGGRVSGDVVETASIGDALHPPPDHDGELALVVEKARAARAAASRRGGR